MTEICILKSCSVFLSENAIKMVENPFDFVSMIEF